MKTDKVHYGSCSCRKVSYRFNDVPLIVHACHCKQCQRVTGSAFVMNALIEKSQLDLLSGDISSIRLQNTCHTAYYCSECATFVWSEYKTGRFDDCWFMRVGTLDEPDRTPPDVHIYVDSKQAWVIIPDNVPTYKNFYRIRDVWDEGSISRILATRDDTSLNNAHFCS